MSRGVKTIAVVTAVLLLAALAMPAFAQEHATPSGETVVVEKKTTADNTNMIVLSAAIVVSTGCLAAGYAVGRVGSAALGAASERPELLGRSLILVGLAEGIAIYGLIIGIMLLGKL